MPMLALYQLFVVVMSCAELLIDSCFHQEPDLTRVVPGHSWYAKKNDSKEIKHVVL